MAEKVKLTRWEGELLDQADRACEAGKLSTRNFGKVVDFITDGSRRGKRRRIAFRQRVEQEMEDQKVKWGDWANIDWQKFFKFILEFIAAIMAMFGL